MMGSIPKVPTCGLRTGTGLGGFTLMLAKAARFRVLQSRADSAAQAIARYALEANPAKYSFEVFYPGLAQELYRLNRVRHSRELPVIIDHSLMEGTYNNMRSMNNLPFTLALSFRSRLANHFPKRVHVPRSHRDMILFLSYHQFDYARDSEGPSFSELQELEESGSVTSVEQCDKQVAEMVGTLEGNSSILGRPRPLPIVAPMLEPHESSSSDSDSDAIFDEM